MTNPEQGIMSHTKYKYRENSTSVEIKVSVLVLISKIFLNGYQALITDPLDVFSELLFPADIY